MTVTRPQYPPFEHVQPTKDDIPFVELGVIDLAKFVDGPQGLDSRRQLAAQLEEAVKTQGFFFLEGHGFPQDKLDYLQAISQAILDLPLEEKERFSAGAKRSDEDGYEDKSKLGAERGSGFKARGYWAMQNGVRDQIEHYNWRNLLHPTIRQEQAYPDLVRHHLPEAVEYFCFLHLVLVRKLSALFDIILELPEGSIWKIFDVTPDRPDLSGGGFGRAMLYHEMSEDDLVKTGNTALRGHADAGALTFITSQPMASLQFRDYHDGKWKYVGYRPNALVVNIGDRFEFLTGGFFKSTIHRVVAPPVDQRGHRRLGLIYFCDHNPTILIDPRTLSSPKLDRLGFVKPDEWERITGEQWDDIKGKSFGKGDVNSTTGEEPAPLLIYGRLAERWHQLGK